MDSDRRAYLMVIAVMIILCIIVLFPLGCQIKQDNKVDPEMREGFYSYNNYFKEYCPSCRYRDRYSCGKCTNCGLCGFNNGTSECVPGNSDGPYYREDCDFWTYGDPYLYYPNTNLFPIVRTKSMVPFTRPYQGWKWAGGFKYGRPT